ncbi:germin-like protein 9-3 [Phoenix dactylifera]|uniref:Germin-like protein n=1 Tax=Phoenix dactylifera TaxID=42345 RepID=A0A8B7C094_PHODC|nr:germin-like protein 9-3 [Phoenix dactylifera]
MAATTLSHALLFLLVSIAIPLIAQCSDPDILADFILPQNLTSNLIDGRFFTFSGMRNPLNGEEPKNFTVLKASMAEFPALNGQSVSYAVLLYPPGAVNPPHTHPRASELLFLAGGYLDVGFVDTANKLYVQTLQPGDMFVFPKGLVHYQYNGGEGQAIAISAFGSASAGTVSIPGSVFATGIDDGILANSFKTDVATVQKIKAGFAPKA